jgi:ADP-ribosylglycohydrolase
MNVNDTRDRIRGSLIGGAVGDALGYAVEFTGENAIFRRYGMPGITAYERSVDTGKALISDDTQMTLFTAEGLLAGEACRRIQPDAGTPHSFVAKAYQDWLLTQELGLEGIRERTDGKEGSRLMNVPELFYARAPGNTCLNALFAARRSGEFDLDYIEKPRNNSKGCGGVMRVAPAALYRKPGRRLRIAQLDEEAAQIAAITHGHPLGYMPAATMNHIISRIVFPEGERKSLKEIVCEARDATEALFDGFAHLDRLLELIDLALTLSENADSDLNNIHRLGEGWIAEEALAIAIYCALRHRDDFSACMIAAVNHKGDSDSTGAIAGNILGAWVGYDAIEEQWKTDLELKDLILEIADALAAEADRAAEKECQK